MPAHVVFFEGAGKWLGEGVGHDIIDMIIDWVIGSLPNHEIDLEGQILVETKPVLILNIDGFSVFQWSIRIINKPKTWSFDSLPGCFIVVAVG